MTALLLGAAELAALHELRELAARHPINAPALFKILQTARGERRHRAQMESQSLLVPFGFRVAFSVETGHPAGTVRHLSVSMTEPGRLPSPEAIWMIAEALGFAGGLEVCKLWPEQLSAGGTAINVAQPVSIAAAPAANGHALQTEGREITE